jgi:hypothetical protein
MKDYTEYATKDITPTMVAFHEWLQNETGLELDLRSVALAGSLRGDFQASESWKADARNPRNGAEARREAKVQEQLAKAEAAAKKAQERIAKLEAAVADAKAKAKADAKKAAEEAKAA